MASRRPTVALLHPLPPAVERALSDRYELIRRDRDDDPTASELRALAGRADAIVSTVTDTVPAEVFDVEGPLRIVANFGVGYERIDVGAARRAGAIVTNTPGALTDCTADLTIALILMVLRRTGEGERLLRAGRWTGWRPTSMLGRRVTGRTLGVIGLGRIGAAVARRARHGFGMSIAYHSRTRAAPELEAELGAEPLPLERLLGRVDVVSLHCPLTPETEGLIDERRLRSFRSDAVLINTARGGLVDEEALAAALRESRIAGAGLDVFRGEPSVSPALLGLDNVVLLPHQGSATIETRTAMGMRVVANLDAFFRGDAVPDPVA
ncbi:MAG: 2-hydroxyacid dehydrogenase [Gemmatimonadales bacterium]